MKLAIPRKIRNASVALASVAATGMASLAMAADAGSTDYAKDAFSSLSSTASTYIESGFAILVVITGASIGMKLFKKFTNKAT